jgi:hypothetical protein
MYKISKVTPAFFSNVLLIQRLLQESVDLALPKKNQGRSEFYQVFIKSTLKIKQAFSLAVKSGDAHMFE